MDTTGKTTEKNEVFSLGNSEQNQLLNDQNSLTDEILLLKSAEKKTTTVENAQLPLTNSNELHTPKNNNPNRSNVNPVAVEQPSNSSESRSIDIPSRRLNNTNRSIALEPDFDLPANINLSSEDLLNHSPEPAGIDQNEQAQEAIENEVEPLLETEHQNTDDNGFIVHQNQALIELTEKKVNNNLKPTALTTERLETRKLRADKLSSQTLQSQRLSAKRISKRKQRQSNNVENKVTERDKRLQQTPTNSEELLKNNTAEQKRIEREKRLDKIKQKTDSKRSENKK
jgi:hypothetical protein